MHAAWFRETPVAVKRTRCLMEVEMNLHAGEGLLLLIARVF